MNLAALLADSGETARARELFELVAEGHHANSGARGTETLRTRYNLALLLSMEDETRPSALELFRAVKELSQAHHPWWEHVCEEVAAADAAGAGASADPPPVAAPSGGDGADSAHAELQQLRPSQLRKRARELGATQEELDDADDAAQPKAAMIALIVRKTEA